MSRFTGKLSHLGHHAERGLVVCGLLLFPGSSVVGPGIMLMLFAVTGIALTWHWRAVQASLNKTVWLLFLPVVLAVGSACWSSDPSMSFSRAFALAGTTVAGGFLALRFDLRDQLTLLALMLGMVAIASTLVALFVPKYGVMTGSLTGAWSGIFYHKNPFGRIMALATLVFSLLAFETGRMRTLAILGLALSLALIIASSSQASMIVALTCLVAVASLAVSQRLSRRHRLRVLCMVLSTVVLMVVWGEPRAESFLTLLGKDLTLTGRMQLWSVLLDKVQLHPWLGYGYGVFWLGKVGVSGEVYKAIGWYPIHAHNGFLDLTLELGFLGLVTFLGLLVIHARQAFSWGMTQRSPLILWPAIYVLFFILSNLAESSLVRDNSIYWALYVSTVITVQQGRLTQTGAGSRLVSTSDCRQTDATRRG